MIATESPFLFYGFIGLTLLVLIAMYWLLGEKRKFLLLGFGWLCVQAILASLGFYANFDSLPPRMISPVAIALLTCYMIGFRSAGKPMREQASLENLHYLHLARIFVEVIFLHGLFELGLVAKAITYEGTNFDLYAGLTGPIIGLLVFRYRLLPISVALVWNIIACAILVSVFVQATLSAPSPIQSIGFDQATTAIFYFPFIWLPTFVAPAMILAHFISIRKIMDLLKRDNTYSS